MSDLSTADAPARLTTVPSACCPGYPAAQNPVSGWDCTVCYRCGCVTGPGDTVKGVVLPKAGAGDLSKVYAVDEAEGKELRISVFGTYYWRYTGTREGH